MREQSLFTGRGTGQIEEGPAFFYGPQKTGLRETKGTQGGGVMKFL